MLLTEKKQSSPFSFFFPQNPKNPPPNSFEQTLITRLNSLLPFPDSPKSIPLSYLSRFIDLLTLTLTDLTAVISSPSISVNDHPALSSHLDSSISLLNSCNAISAAVDRILHGSLLVRLALRLISSSASPDRIRRARSAIAQWEAAEFAPSDLRRFRSDGPNRGEKVRAVRRAIYAVEVISDIVVRLAFAFLGEKDDFLIGVFVPGEFVWGAAYNEVVAEVSGRIYCGEIEAMNMRVKKLGVVVDEDDGGGGVTEGLRDAAKGAEEAVVELTEGMDGLGKAVNGLFRSSLESREAALQCFRVWNGRCI